MDTIFTPKYRLRRWIVLPATALFALVGLLLTFVGKEPPWKAWGVFLLFGFGFVILSRDLIKRIRFGPHSMVIEHYFRSPREIPYRNVIDFGLVAVKFKKGGIAYGDMTNAADLLSVFDSLTESGAITEVQLENRLIPKQQVGAKAAMIGIPLAFVVAACMAWSAKLNLDIGLLWIICYIPIAAALYWLFNRNSGLTNR